MGLTTYTCTECGKKRPVATKPVEGVDNLAVVDSKGDFLTLDCSSMYCGTETFVHPLADGQHDN